MVPLARFEEITCDGRGASLTAADSRLPRFIAAERSMGAMLATLKVAVVGVGSVGRVAALHFARLMIATLFLVDRGRYKASSLLTHPVGPDEIGREKASSTGRLAKSISPRTRVLAHDGPFDRLDETALADADVVVLATDNLLAEVEAGQVALRLRVPLVQASVYGPTLTAQVRFHGNLDGEGPCPACAYGEAEWALLDRNARWSCEGAAPDPAAEPRGEPTLSVSALCSIAADLAVIQILRHVAGLGRTVTDTMLEYAGYTGRTVATPLRRNPNCPVDHVAYEREVAPRGLGDCSLADLAREAGLSAPEGLDDASFEVGGAPFVEAAPCAACGALVHVRRFSRAGSGPAATCGACGGATAAHPFYAHRAVPSDLARPILGVPLREAGVESPGWVLVRSRSRAVLFLSSRNGSPS